MFDNMDSGQKLALTLGGVCYLFISLMGLGAVNSDGVFILLLIIISPIAIPFLIIYCKKKKKEKEENAPLVGEAKKFHEIYMLAPNESFSRLYTRFMSKFLTLKNYEQTESVNAECKALLKESKIRESFIENYKCKKMNQGELFSEIDLWIAERVRPEVIQKRLFECLEMITNSKTDEEKAKILAPIIEATLIFNSGYFKYMDDKDGWEEMTRSIAEKQYNNISVKGLGFGLITSSVSNAVLFSAMDTLEKHKQIRNQTSAIWSKTNSIEKKQADELYKKIMELYRQDYKNKIREAIELVFEKLN